MLFDYSKKGVVEISTNIMTNADNQQPIPVEHPMLTRSKASKMGYMALLTTSTKKITVKKAMKLYSKEANESIFKELWQIDKKGTWIPVDVSQLSKN